MVLCFVALIVFAILGIFSAKYRQLAREAFSCVVRTATLRPCESSLDERMHAAIVSAILPHSPTLARVVHKRFALLSLLFTLLFFASLAYSAISVYNYWAYGNCNGPNSTAFCVFDSVLGSHSTKLIPYTPGVGPVLGNGSIALVEVGCFSCPFTRAAQEPLKQFLAAHPQVRLEFRAFPIPTHENSFISAQAAFCADEQHAFWPYYDALFNDSNHSMQNLLALSSAARLNVTEFTSCMQSNATVGRVNSDLEAGKQAGIYGTPTFFIGNASLVGPNSAAEFDSLLSGVTSTPAPGNVTGGVCPPPAGAGNEFRNSS